MLDLKDLAELHRQFGDLLDAPVRAVEISGRTFSGHPQTDLMGVVNLSSDSWYRESVSLGVDAAIERGRRLLTDGAAVIDIGAESTLPGAERAGAGQQLEKLLPVVGCLAGEGAIVSVESYQREVAEACLQAGARVINLTAAEETDDFYRLARDHDAAVIACYLQNAAHPHAAQAFEVSDDHTAVLLEYFSRESDKAERAGLEHLWIDAGLGFYYKNLDDSAARVDYQMRTFLNAFRLRKIGRPVCQALPHAFEFFRDEVRCAEPFFSVLAMIGRIDLIRTHEVSRVKAVLRTMNAFRDE